MSSSTFVIKVEKRATNDNDDDVDADGIWSLLIWICARIKLDDVDRFHRLLCRNSQDPCQYGEINNKPRDFWIHCLDTVVNSEAGTMLCSNFTVRFTSHAGSVFVLCRLLVFRFFFGYRL